MARHRGKGFRLHQLSHRHEPRRRPQPGPGPLQSRRQVHGRAVVDRSRPGHEVGHGTDCGRNPGRADRGRLRRHRGFRYRPALHGLVRLARHAPGRQCRHPGGAGSPCRHARSGRRGTRGQRRRSRNRWQRQHPCPRRAVAFDHRDGGVPGGAVQAGQVGLGARHLPDTAVGRRRGDRRNDTRLLLCPRRHGGRGRGRR